MLDFLQQSARESTAITTHVLASTDHDGVCATKILLNVLHQLDVKNALFPVTANDDIIKQLRELEGDTEVRSLVLLNCGAGLDLEQQLEECGASPNLCCYVIDAHRPMVLANLKPTHQRVIVIDDDPIGEASGIRPPVEGSQDDASTESDGDLDRSVDASDSEGDKENE